MYTEDKLNKWHLGFCEFLYRRTLFLDLTEGAMVCLVSMLPVRGDQRVTYSRTVLVLYQCHHFTGWISTHCKRVLLAFKSNTVAADGHDGIVHIVLILQSRVDVHHFKIHWNTAEPAKQTGKRREEPFLTLVFCVLCCSFQPENLPDVIKELGTDPVARYERHSVSASVLCRRRLEHEIVQNISRLVLKLNKTLV